MAPMMLSKTLHPLIPLLPSAMIFFLRLGASCDDSPQITAELKRWITVTAPSLSAPRMPTRRARRRSHDETAAMNCRTRLV